MRCTGPAPTDRAQHLPTPARSDSALGAVPETHLDHGVPGQARPPHAQRSLLVKPPPRRVPGIASDALTPAPTGLRSAGSAQVSTSTRRVSCEGPAP
eukprot:CAMPEP_0179290498 /NCGR_PEP_ID=MMETSP0797-20121207/41846_1 /TAXON_ID=47934 /ORGANISM="Dinophysis acuminata, Strain DAEP01" /LENGTH=96 /DNA_ID=CAMNT_0020999531 /DNA_START=96 /DNA_END=383 /DNA_ORIENTATION=-